jgi:hypothetical protein
LVRSLAVFLLHVTELGVAIAARNNALIGERSSGNVVKLQASRIVLSADHTKSVVRAVAGRFGDGTLFPATISANDAWLTIVVITAVRNKLKAAPVVFVALTHRPVGPEPFQGRQSPAFSIDRVLIHWGLASQMTTR